VKLPVQPLAKAPVQRHIRSLHEQPAVPDWWASLYQTACNGAVFLSQEWLGTWLECYGDAFDGKWVSWSCDGRVVGGCLLLIKPVKIGGLSFRTIFLNASGATAERSPLAECNDVLYVEGFGDAIADDLTALLSEMEWHRLDLAACATDGIVSRVFSAVPSRHTEIEHKVAPYINFSDLPDAPFNKNLTGNTRSQIQRCQRIYEGMAGPVSLNVAASIEQALQYFDEMAHMHNARWSLKGAVGSFSNQLAVKFHRTLISRLWPGGAVDLVCVKAGETNIGFLYNFITFGKAYFFQSGFAYQQNNKLKPGLLTHSLAIENYRQRGLREYDFMVGNAPYKRSFSTHERALFWGTVYRGSRSVSLLLCAKKLKSVLRKYKSTLQ
jgi:hypothetical protein